MAKKNSSSNYEDLFCPTCDQHAKTIAELAEKLKNAESKLQAAVTELTKMRIVLVENDLLLELDDISDTEAICVEQISRLKELSVLRTLTESETKILDTMYKNLRTARNEERKKKREERMFSGEQLLEMVKGGKEN